MERVKPITPQEAIDGFIQNIPPKIIEAVNELLMKKASPLAKSITIKQDEILELVCDENLTRSMVFKNKWLDIEEIYRGAGWNVEYDKPAFNETYDAYFVFKKKEQ